MTTMKGEANRETDSGLLQRLNESTDKTPVYHNTSGRRKTMRKLDWKDMPDRYIVSGYPDMHLPHNGISTTKYTAVTFIPKNLLEQFSKLANVYFLIIGLLQMIPAISVSKGIPVIYGPLGVIIIITALKDLVEDCKRRKDDHRENYAKTQKLTENGFIPCNWIDLRVGDVIKVRNNDFIPADLILLGTSEADGACYIETKNLDGETNLKPRYVDKSLGAYFVDEMDILTKKIEINYEKPNPYLYTFRGNMKLQSGQEIPLTNNNFLLRATSLKSPHAIGMVAYTGHDTKIMLNSVSARGKSSRLERSMNKQIVLVFIMQNVMCILIALYATIWNSNNKPKLDAYLHYKAKDIESNAFYYFFAKYGNWIVIFTNFVPISLLVTLEMVKVIQGSILSKDKRMEESVHRTPAAVQTSRLMEELGQISYIFSDKTGTLTCNIMEFKKFSVLGESFGENYDHDMTRQHSKSKVTNVDFKDSSFFEVLSTSDHSHHSHAHESLMLLSTCHTIAIDKETNQYSASSPDELALVNFAKMCGYEYIKKTENDELIVEVNGKQQKHKLLHVLEFDSDRKRMSVIVETERGDIVLYCKGADSIIIDRMCSRSNHSIDQIKQNVQDYANKGLRTLLIAKKELDKATYNAWNNKYMEASTSINNRETRMAALQEDIETNLVIIGATAIEDKLQDDVGDTIKACKDAGINVWVLTGDKTETAINIGYSCKLLDKSQKILIIDVETPEELVNRIKEVEEEARHRLEVEKGIYALVVTGKSLIYSQSGDLSDRLYNVFSKANAVVACRVSPKQKRDIVELVKGKVPEAVTLAIGDGANDVNMITAAHVGIGIKGVEGYQAARASDFAIGEFKLLRRLLLFYGRESYRKNSVLVLYNFFKNQLLILPIFWYGFQNGMSGTSLYEPVIFQFYNVLYASLPIVIYAVFDKEFKGSFLEKNPSYYTPGITDQYFNMKLFWTWFTAGSTQAIVIAVTAFAALNLGGVDSGGRTIGFFSAGMMAYSSLIVCANLKILLFTNTFNVLVYSILFGSIIVYIVSFAFLSGAKTSGNFNEFGLIFGHPYFYIGTILMICGTTMIDLAVSRYAFCANLATDEKANTQIRRQSLKNAKSPIIEAVDLRRDRPYGVY